MDCGIIFPGKTFSGHRAVFNLLKDGKLVRDEKKDRISDSTRYTERDDKELFEPAQISKTAVSSALKAAKIAEELATLARMAATTAVPVKIGEFM